MCRYVDDRTRRPDTLTPRSYSSGSVAFSKQQPRRQKHSVEGNGALPLPSPTSLVTVSETGGTHGIVIRSPSSTTANGEKQSGCPSPANSNISLFQQKPPLHQQDTLRRRDKQFQTLRTAFQQTINRELFIEFCLGEEDYCEAIESLAVVI